MSIIYQGGETKKWDQGQYTFAIRQFPPFHAMKVLGELQKVLAPALGGAIGGIKPETLDQDTNNVIFIGNTVADALNGLARSMDGHAGKSIFHVAGPGLCQCRPASYERLPTA